MSTALPPGYDAIDVLVVDDLPHTRQLMRGLLRHLGVQRVNEAADVAEALDIIRLTPPDIVFTDWDMPGGSGLDLVRAIRTGADTPNPTLPVILLTAHGRPDYVQAGRDAGATDFLVKPIAPAKVRDRILDVVARPRGFVCAPGYRGPDRRRAERPVAQERRSPEAPAAGVLLLAPDPVLTAKVAGDHEALRVALRQRADGLRRVAEHAPAAVPLPLPGAAACADAMVELEALTAQALGAMDRCADALARMAAPLGIYRAAMAGQLSEPTQRVIASLQRMISDPAGAGADPTLIRLHLAALRAMLRAGSDPTARCTAEELVDQIDALVGRRRSPPA